ncbi:hypothetical protein DENSPDRAFT_322747 [Dentipellis sp. KUC8613]|nr:hypothetical protein DENSPDRAFT_322747 [Dentipellis sp. KUC8613]
MVDEWARRIVVNVSLVERARSSTRDRHCRWIRKRMSKPGWGYHALLHPLYSFEESRSVLTIGAVPIVQAGLSIESLMSSRQRQLEMMIKTGRSVRDTYY